jgi:hypothetical protein
MNGLTAANVDHLTEAIKQSIDRYKAGGKKETAGALEDLLYAINEMKRYNTTQASRPDRVGDECWYAATSSTYRKGILRAWFEDFAIVEDCETNRATQTHDVYFSTEAPK